MRALEFPKLETRGSFLEVSIMRSIVRCGLCCGTLIEGNHHSGRAP